MTKNTKLGAAIVAVFFVIAAIFFGTQMSTESEQIDDTNIQEFREKQIDRWGPTGIVTSKKVTEEAEKLFSRPVEDQSIKDLKLLAKKANAAANYVDLILDKYKDYHNENYRYDFVKDKLAPHHDSYVKIFNKMVDYRNKAFFNLGKKYVDKNEPLIALFYFRDAYRLSRFADIEIGKDGMRYKAEQEMKKLLDIEEVSSFVHWKREEREERKELEEWEEE